MSVGGNNNLLFGTDAELPNPNGNDQIVLGTASSSLLIQGSLNYNVGEMITSTTVLPAAIAQFYLIGGSETFIIRLPLTADCKGAMVTFRRQFNSTSNICNSPRYLWGQNGKRK
jgi:hypothetical protein